MKVGILETGAASQHVIKTYGDSPMRFAAYFSAFPQIQLARFPVYQTATAPDPREADAWIIPGSPDSAYEDFPWVHALTSFVQKISGLPIPLLGICFGHQLMAIAHGGKVEKSSKGRGIGVHTYDVTEDGRKLFPDYDRLHLMASHQDQVVALPPQATLLARSAFCPYAALAYGKYSLSLQPHPEFLAPYARHVLLEWQKRDPIDTAIQDEALHSLENQRADGPQIASTLTQFLEGKPIGGDA